MRFAPTAVWALLVALTTVGWLLAEEGSNAALGTTVVILIAAVKINLVISRFMELDWRPLPFRLLTMLWLGVATSTILGGYWL